MVYRESLGLNGNEVSSEVKKLTEGIKGMNRKIVFILDPATSAG